MAGKKKKAPEADEATTHAESGKSGGGPMRLIMIIVPSLALVAAGYFFGGGGGGSATPAAATVTVTVLETEPEVGEIVDLDAVNVNLSDGHYLRVAVSLGLAAHDEGGEDGGGHGATTDGEEPVPIAPAADIILTTFAGQSMATLTDLERRIELREHLEEALREYYGEEQLVEIFFTEFVMQ